MKIIQYLALFLAFISFTSRGFSQNIQTNADNHFYQETGPIGRVHPVSPPPRENGRDGAISASRAGFQSGITTAQMVAGVVVASIVTVAALLLCNSGGAHAH